MTNIIILDIVNQKIKKTPNGESVTYLECLIQNGNKTKLIREAQVEQAAQSDKKLMKVLDKFRARYQKEVNQNDEESKLQVEGLIEERKEQPDLPPPELIYQPEQQQVINVSITRTVGSFDNGDKPMKILQVARGDNNNHLFVIDWYPNNQGIKPLQSVEYQDVIKRECPNLLLEFYTSIIRLS
ncbi:hypothetical protein FGO68_gene10979 [Halteria grandinella]|uniref:Uncharacterized protein n=1 Tax=Halteria grandinella TaxID=5974 RepID=A0A8J8NYM9_HALGN|nr:hypothetical protein FGO68_gene10979 [Halteria grandinella]